MTTYSLVTKIGDRELYIPSDTIAQGSEWLDDYHVLIWQTTETWLTFQVHHSSGRCYNDDALGARLFSSSGGNVAHSEKPTEESCIMEGFSKWDRCTQWTCENQWHYDDWQSVPDVRGIIKRIHAIAGQYMPHVLDSVEADEPSPVVCVDSELRIERARVARDKE